MKHLENRDNPVHHIPAVTLMPTSTLSPGPPSVSQPPQVWPSLSISTPSKQTWSSQGWAVCVPGLAQSQNPRNTRPATDLWPWQKPRNQKGQARVLLDRSWLEGHEVIPTTEPILLFCLVYSRGKIIIGWIWTLHREMFTDNWKQGLVSLASSGLQPYSSWQPNTSLGCVAT